MINNKDPLIAAVQKVMQDSYAERNAVKVVNEKFGIVDRRVLPRENQGEWDAAYQMVLSEGVEALDEKVHPSKYSSKQKELAAVGKNVDPDDNPKTIGRADLKAASMGHASHIGKAKKMKGDNPLSEEGDPSKAIPVESNRRIINTFTTAMMKDFNCPSKACCCPKCCKLIYPSSICSPL